MFFHLFGLEEALQVGDILLDGSQILQALVVEILHSNARWVKSGL